MITEWASIGVIRKRCAFLLITGRWSDCSFSVGKEQVKIKGHKIVLALASPVFEAMFYGSMRMERDEPIAIPDIPLRPFRKLLLYMYTSGVQIDSFDCACDLYYAAQKYLLPQLVTICTTYLSTNLVPQLACRTYEFANFVGEIKLMEKSLKMIHKDTKLALTDEKFHELLPESVVKLFSMEPLNIDSELDLFAAAERYVKALDDQNTTEVAGSSTNNVQTGPNVENCEVSSQTVAILKGDNAGIRSALQQIRFLTLSGRQLAEYQTLTSLLTENEILALLMNISSEKTHMPMPEGFSICRINRRTK